MEIQQMWNMKCMIVWVITGATGIITKGLKKNVEIISGKHSLDSLQRIAVLGTHSPPLFDEGGKACDTRHNNCGGGGCGSARIEGIRERKGIIPLIHNLGARYRIVSVTTLSIYSRRKGPQLPVAICVDPRLV